MRKSLNITTILCIGFIVHSLLYRVISFVVRSLGFKVYGLGFTRIQGLGIALSSPLVLLFRSSVKPHTPWIPWPYEATPLGNVKQIVWASYLWFDVCSCYWSIKEINMKEANRVYVKKITIDLALALVILIHKCAICIDFDVDVFPIRFDEFRWINKNKLFWCVLMNYNGWKDPAAKNL